MAATTEDTRLKVMESVAFYLDLIKVEQMSASGREVYWNLDLMKKEDAQMNDCVLLEMRMAELMAQQEASGFRFDVSCRAKTFWATRRSWLS